MNLSRWFAVVKIKCAGVAMNDVQFDASSLSAAYSDPLEESPNTVTWLSVKDDIWLVTYLVPHIDDFNPGAKLLELSNRRRTICRRRQIVNLSVVRFSAHQLSVQGAEDAGHNQVIGIADLPAQVLYRFVTNNARHVCPWHVFSALCQQEKSTVICSGNLERVSIDIRCRYRPSAKGEPLFLARILREDFHLYVCQDSYKSGDRID
jgi:hypothetical protein